VKDFISDISSGRHPRSRVLEFDNYFEVLDFVREGKVKAGGVGKYLHQEGGGSSYSGGGFNHSIESTLELIEHGWPEGDKAVHATFQAVKGRLSEIADGYQVEYDVSGSWLDMGRFVAGEPECFGELVADYKEKPSVKIVLNQSISGAVNRETIRNRGAALLAFIDALRPDYDISLEVINFMDCANSWGSEFKSLGCMLRFKVDCSQDYSRDMVAFWTCNERVQRSLVFALQEILAERHDLGGYGHIAKYKAAEDEFLFGALRFGDANISSFSTLESSVDYVKKAVGVFNERFKI